MGTETVNENPFIPDADRVQISLEASWEIASLVADVLAKVKALDVPVDDLSIRGMLIRTDALACLIMSALGDHMETLADMRQRLTGQRAEVTHG